VSEQRLPTWTQVYQRSPQTHSAVIWKPRLLISYQAADYFHLAKTAGPWSSFPLQILATPNLQPTPVRALEWLIPIPNPPPLGLPLMGFSVSLLDMPDLWHLLLLWPLKLMRSTE
jgi:hypothetical protein